MKVALLNPAFSGFAGQSSEQCCFGPSVAPVPLSSTLSGVASEFLRRGYEVKWASLVPEVPSDCDAILIVVVVGYERATATLAKWLRHLVKGAKLIALAVPPGLAKTMDLAPYDYVVGPNPVPTVMHILLPGAVPSYFPELHGDAFPPQGFMPWLLTSGEGCRDSCSLYCSWGQRAPMVHRPVQNTITSLEVMMSSKYSHRAPPYLVCAEINADRRWMRELAVSKMASGVHNVPIITDLRADWLLEGDIETLIDLKTVEVIAALESSNPKVLAAMGRHMDPLKYAAGYKRLRDAGIKVMCPVMFGASDDENPEEVASFCAKHEIVPNSGVMKLYPGTRGWDENPEYDTYREWPGPAEPLRVRKGINKTLAKLQKFKDLMGLK